MKINCLTLTGFPGWLTQALLENCAAAPVDGLGEVRGLVHPGLVSAAEQLRERTPLVRSIRPFDLASRKSDLREISTALTGSDVLVHSAAVIHVCRTAEWYRINTEGTLRLAHAARQAGVRRFVFISSNAAGGRCESVEQVLTESDPARPLSHYGRSKWLAEKGLLEMHRPGEFEVVILRPSMFYGPPVPDRHIDVYRRILSGRMPMVGTGNYRRSITYIDNLVQATRLAMLYPAAAGEVFYIVDDPIYTTLSITQAMASALGVPLKVFRLPAIIGPMAYSTDRLLASVGLYWQNLHLVGEAHWHVALSCAKAKRLLGYSPEVTLKEGMQHAVEWCRSRGKL